jgi:hypothetical protein
MNSTKLKHATGYVAIRDSSDIRKALARRINRILMDRGEDHHGGQLAALCNAWINAARLGLDMDEIKAIQEEIKNLKRLVEEGRS